METDFNEKRIDYKTIHKWATLHKDMLIAKDELHSEVNKSIEKLSTNFTELMSGVNSLYKQNPLHVETQINKIGLSMDIIESFDRQISALQQKIEQFTSSYDNLLSNIYKEVDNTIADLNNQRMDSSDSNSAQFSQIMQRNGNVKVLDTGGWLVQGDERYIQGLSLTAAYEKSQNVATTVASRTKKHRAAKKK
jgi:Skp family chaperone for outer membrane proteins